VTVLSRSLLAQIAHAGSHWEDVFGRLSKRIGVQKALWAVAHRLLRLIWKIQHAKVADQERGPRAWDPVSLARSIRRLQRQFAALGYELCFTRSTPDAPNWATAWGRGGAEVLTALWRAHSCVPYRHLCRYHRVLRRVSTRHARVRAPLTPWMILALGVAF